MSDQRNSTGFPPSPTALLPHRRGKIKVREPNDSDLDDMILKTERLSIEQSNTSDKRAIIDYINPLALTLLSAGLRLYRLNASKQVIWDEAHFGKFASFYLKREFYFDVHPPLGKLLVGLSGFIAGYKGDFGFDSGTKYPDHCNYTIMRVFNCIFGILCTPVAYKTAVLAGYSQLAVWFISLLVVFEMSSLILSKFILLDSILLLFTVTTYYCLVKLHKIRLEKNLLSKNGILALISTGISLGCVCSVKWVGLFVTVLVGIYTIYDLSIRTYQLLHQSETNFRAYVAHWVSRVVTLICIPLVIYMACFKVHFLVLNRTGTGDGSISTLLQASLLGNTLKESPRDVAYGSLVSLRSQGLSPNLLHSHNHQYPEGSQQQQITTYGFKDSNNNFIVEFDLKSAEEGKFGSLESKDNSAQTMVSVEDGDTVRLVHLETNCLLHSHSHKAPVLDSHFEVSCYGNLDINDRNDEWVLEIKEQSKSPSSHFSDENVSHLHPISTSFRLRHKLLGCYLATTGLSLPLWGFQQGEVVCKFSYLSRDKSTWWNIEDHLNDLLKPPKYQYVPPSPKFWKEFVSLNFGMMASNNALIPDPDRFDRLSSKWWQWPTLNIGLMMGSWSIDDVRYYLIGHPVITWFSTASLVFFLAQLLFIAYRWHRQVKDYSKTWNSILIQGVTPFVGWFLHFYPFVVMGRVTYVHHYVPALYFAIFVAAFVLDSSLRKLSNKLRLIVFGLLYTLIVSVFWFYSPLALGMTGRATDFRYLKLLSTWTI